MQRTQRLIVLLTAWLLCSPSGQAAPPTVSLSEAKAQFEAAGKRAAALRAGFGKLRGARLARVAGWSKAAAKTAVTIIQAYERLVQSGARPFAARAACEAGQLQSGLAEAVYQAWMQAAVPKTIGRLGPTAMLIYRQKVHEAAQDLAVTLDQTARPYHERCLRSASCATYFPAAKRLLRRSAQRRASYAAALGQAAASQPGAPTRRTQTWWYTRCRALEIVTKAQAPSPAECISLVVAELKRLVRRGEHLARRRKWRAAIGAYTRALILDPDWAPARRGRALCNAALGNRKAAALDLVWWRKHKAGTPAAAQLDEEVARRLKKRHK